MSLWHVDIVLDLAWIVAHGGQVPEPTARASNIDSRGRPVEFLCYGDSEALNHLRVMIDADDAEEAQAIVGLNIALWRDAVTVTSVMATPTIRRRRHSARIPARTWFGLATAVRTRRSSHWIFNGPSPFRRTTRQRR